MNSRVAAAVERALDARQREATEEVERILDAALVVMERVAPTPPRVSDIVEQAGTSNAAFYRYFSGKDDVILAVLERGVGLVVSYLDHEIAKERTPLGAVARWIEGTVAQVSDPHLTSMSRAALSQLAVHKDNDIAEPLRRLLHEHVLATGCADPERATDAVFAAVIGTVRQHVAAASQASADETAYLVSFCLKAIDPEVPESKAATRRAATPTRTRRKTRS